MIRRNSTKFIKEYVGEHGPDRCVTRNINGGQFGERKTLTTDTTYFSTTEKFIPEYQRVINRQQKEEERLYGVKPTLNITAENPYRHFMETDRESHSGKIEDSEHWLKGGYEVKSDKISGNLVTINTPQDIAFCEEWFDPDYTPDVPTTRVKENHLYPSRIRYVPEEDRDVPQIEPKSPVRRRVIYPNEDLYYQPHENVKYPYNRSTVPTATKGWRHI